MEKRALWNNNFLLIASGNLISRLGTVIFDLSLIWWLTQETGSAKYSGYILAASLIPIAVLGPISGVLSDRLNKKLLLISSDIISGIVTIGVSVMAYHNHINMPLLIIACFLLGVSSSLFKPTIRSIIPELVSKKHLVKANSVTNNLGEVTKVIGPLIAGILMAIPSFGVPGALFINGLSFLLSGILTVFVKYTSPSAKKTYGTIIGDLKAGFSYIFSNSTIKKLIILCGSVNFFLVSFNVLLPLYVLKVIDGQAGIYSYALTAEAVGGIAITVVILLSKGIQPRPQSLAWFITLAGMSLLLIPIFKTTISLLVLTFMQGLFMGAFNTLFFTYVQEQVEQDYLGRVFSIIFMIAIIVQPISFIIFGYLGDHIIGSAFIYAGIGTIFCTLPLLNMEKRSSKIETNVSNT